MLTLADLADDAINESTFDKLGEIIVCTINPMTLEIGGVESPDCRAQSGRHSAAAHYSGSLKTHPHFSAQDKCVGTSGWFMPNTASSCCGKKKKKNPHVQ